MPVVNGKSPRVLSPEPRVKSPEPRMKSPEPRVKSPDSRTRAPFEVVSGKSNLQTIMEQEMKEAEVR